MRSGSHTEYPLVQGRHRVNIALNLLQCRQTSTDRQWLLAYSQGVSKRRPAALPDVCEKQQVEETAGKTNRIRERIGKMKRTLIYGVLAAVMIMTTSCATVDLNRGQQGVMGGAAGGALLGQLIGRDTEATLIGAAVGGLLGYVIGNEMDKYDRQRLNHAFEYAPSGQTAAWRNPDSGNSYQVVPRQAYSSPSAPQGVCREAEIIAYIDGRTEKTYTTACRDQYGQWQLQG